MKKIRKSRAARQAGVALLIAIFVLLLISVLAVSLIVSSGTESALAGNYRSSASVLYAAEAGLEEGRGRLLPKNPDYINNAAGMTNFLPAAGPLAIGTVGYIINAAPGETVTPAVPSSKYGDNEYLTEFGSPITSATVKSTTSVSTVTSGGTTYQGPLFKWVRISAATEQSIGVDVNNDGVLNNTIPLYYNSAASPPSLIVSATPPATALQAFEVTSFAVLPNGSERLLRYLVTATKMNLTVPSAVTLDGKNTTFSGGSSNNWADDGIDQQGGGPICSPVQPNVPALGYTNAGDFPGYSFPKPSNYTGSSLAPPASNTASGTSTAVNISATIAANQNLAYLQTPASLDAMVQTISQNADAVLTGPVTNANMPGAMSAANPMTVVVNGDFSMSGNFTGYGVLVVTGNFTATGTTGWNGIVMVVGLGQANVKGTVQINGAVIVAQTQNPLGTELPTLGAGTYSVSGGGNGGVYYNSCLVSSSQATTSFKVLSFREINYNH
ncbi:MAG TPA: pilus assembly PilX N-terminal domain-containing protein [Candidatus Acidoferrum sp.]|nr:pilus assembly PilX N-terminal domain-containing protein [Candidatus Acidoferrum sp.]